MKLMMDGPSVTSQTQRAGLGGEITEESNILPTLGASVGEGVTIRVPTHHQTGPKEGSQEAWREVALVGLVAYPLCLLPACLEIEEAAASSEGSHKPS